jgi:N-acetyl-anhydromuramyl-L-alanine amidase AmpD
MMITRRLLLGVCSLVLGLQLSAQQPEQNFGSYFAEAYGLYPNIPKGVLEAAAYSASHMYNLSPQTDDDGDGDEVGMPQRFGLFGLIEDGKGYFKNNLTAVCSLSGITPERFKKDVHLQILAVAKFLSKEAGVQDLTANSTPENFSVALDKLSEIPDDGSAINKYAHSLYTYDVYNHLKQGFTSPGIKLPARSVQFEKIYPAKTLRLLRTPGVQVNVDEGRISADDAELSTEPTSSISEVAAAGPDYPSAKWDQASTSNFTVGRGGTAITNVVVHTTQGSYAGTISWFNNASAKVSAHYVIRSSDGQVTQMVREKDKAWHVLNHNGYTIGIEHEGYVAQGNTWYTTAMYKSSSALVRDICRGRNIDGKKCFRGPASSGANPQPKTVRIKGHQHYSGNTHTDPGKYWNWTKYANLISPPSMAAAIAEDADDKVTTNSDPSGLVKKGGDLKVVPNPVRGSSVTVEFTLHRAAQPARITITNNYGYVAQQRSVILHPGINRFTLSVSSLKAGLYNVTIRLNATGETESTQLIVVK